MHAGLEGCERCFRPARWVCGVCAISSCFDHTSGNFLSCMCADREEDVAPVAAAAAAEAAERARRAASAATATAWAAGPAAVGLQRLFRGHRVRQRERQIEPGWVGHCAVRLQSLFRGYRVRCAVADWYQQRALISLHLLQRRWDDVHDAAVVAEAAAATVIQGMVRGATRRTAGPGGRTGGPSTRSLDGASRSTLSAASCGGGVRRRATCGVSWRCVPRGSLASAPETERGSGARRAKGC